ncbi:MAG: 2-hydroxyacid dehydrogenase [Methanotrichaceae archaeon]|nr:2-hydroxyacid dehydrogenase [Methanotrichaceae archaeon]
MKQNVLSLAPLPAELVKVFILQTPDVPDFDVVYGHDMVREELCKAFSTADAVLGDYTFKNVITSDLLEKAGAIKLIQQPSVGYQHIDIDSCTARGVRVANTPGANTVSVAEHTIAWGLCMLRNLFAAHRSMKEGRWEQMGIRPSELSNKVWGLVGFGQIGRAVASRLKPFCLGQVVYNDISCQPKDIEKELNVEYRDLAELLKTSDIVSIHTPFTDATAHLIGHEELLSMKPTAYLIKVARGGIVDEKALAEAVDKGRIAGAAIDVFSEEPPGSESPLMGEHGDKILLSPHVAGVSNEAAARIINMAAENIARVLKGQDPLHVINPFR